MNEEFSSLGQAIAIAVFLVFVVMAAQFESPKFSIMVMTTIPFSRSEPSASSGWQTAPSAW